MRRYHRTRRMGPTLGLTAAMTFTPALHGQVSATAELTLAAAVDAAFRWSPRLLRAEALVDGATADSDAARSAYLPGVAVDGSATRFQEPMLVAPLHEFDPTRIPDFDPLLLQSRVGAAYTVWDGGARSARSRAADAGVLRSRALVGEAEAALLESVTATYLTVRTGREVVDASVAFVAALAEEAQQAGLRVDEGAAPRVDALRAEAALSDARVRETEARSRLTIAESALARLTGIESTDISGAALPAVRARGAPGASILEDGSDSRRPSPGVVAARTALDAAHARVAVQHARRAPKVDAGAGLLTFASGAGDFVTEWQAGLQVNWPVFTGGATSAAVRRARADLEAAEQDVRAEELAQSAALTEAGARIAEAEARTVALTNSVAQWDEVARIEALALEAGAGVQSEWLRAQAALFQARASLSAARADRIVALVRRARAAGALDQNWMHTALEMGP